MVKLTSRFASAFGLGPSAEDPEKKDDKETAGKKAKPTRMDGESDDDYAKRCEEDEKKCAEEEKEKEAANKKAEDEKKDDEKKEARAEGVTAERERWTTVLASPDAKGKGLQAATLLADTDMSVTQISAVLKVTPAAKAGGGVYARMAEIESTTPKPGTGGAEAPAAGSAGGIAAQIMAAAAKARGETKAA